MEFDNNGNKLEFESVKIVKINLNLIYRFKFQS